jgi:hypothetical protein
MLMSLIGILTIIPLNDRYMTVPCRITTTLMFITAAACIGMYAQKNVWVINELVGQEQDPRSREVHNRFLESRDNSGIFGVFASFLYSISTVMCYDDTITQCKKQKTRFILFLPCFGFLAILGMVRSRASELKLRSLEIESELEDQKALEKKEEADTSDKSIVAPYMYQGVNKPAESIRKTSLSATVEEPDRKDPVILKPPVHDSSLSNIITSYFRHSAMPQAGILVMVGLFIQIAAACG